MRQVVSPGLLTESRFLLQLQSVRAMDARLEADRADAIANLLEIYSPFLLELAKQYIPETLQSKVSRSDITQAVVISALTNFDEFETDTQESWLVWLTKICENKAYDYLRMYTDTKKRDYRKEVHLNSNESRDLLQELAMPDDQRQRETTEDLVEQTQQGLRSLKPHHRQVILWRIQDCLSWKEIGERLECTPDSCRMLYERALKKLRQYVIRQVQEPGAINF